VGGEQRDNYKMAKTRMVNTRFWSDNFIREHLNPLDRYLFLYFLTNDKTNIAGVYELPLSMITSETGIEKEMVLKMLKRLEGKIDYFGGWVIIRNFVKYQNTDSPTVKIGIKNSMSEIPSNIKAFIDKGIPYVHGIDTVGIQPEESEPESESEFESKSELKQGFERVWVQYPKKADKKKAMDKWLRLTIEERILIEKDIPARIKGRKWREGFVENFITYLNGERWNDEIETVEIKNKVIHIQEHE
jgi:hypothetical protein